MTALAGLFLILHGLIHIPVWVAPAPRDAPFDSRRSWLLGDVTGASRTLAVVCCVLFVASGGLVLAGFDAGAVVAAVAAALSLLLAGVTFNRWFLAALVINAGIIIVAVG